MTRALYARERDPVLIVQGLGGPQDWPGRMWKISPSPGFDPRAIQPVPSRYTDWANPVHTQILIADWIQVYFLSPFILARKGKNQTIQIYEPP
jgi:hypothetical protein